MNLQVERMEDQIKTIVVEATPVDSEIPPTEKERVEEFKISYPLLANFVKQALHQGNVRTLLIHSKQGQKLIELPLLVSIIGAIVGSVLFPFAAGVAAIAFLAANLTLVIERKE